MFPQILTTFALLLAVVSARPRRRCDEHTQYNATIAAQYNSTVAPVATGWQSGNLLASAPLTTTTTVLGYVTASASAIAAPLSSVAASANVGDTCSQATTTVTVDETITVTVTPTVDETFVVTTTPSATAYEQPTSSVFNTTARTDTTPLPSYSTTPSSMSLGPVSERTTWASTTPLSVYSTTTPTAEVTSTPSSSAATQPSSSTTTSTSETSSTPSPSAAPKAQGGSKRGIIATPNAVIPLLAKYPKITWSMNWWEGPSTGTPSDWLYLPQLNHLDPDKSWPAVTAGLNHTQSPYLAGFLEPNDQGYSIEDSVQSWRTNLEPLSKDFTLIPPIVGQNGLDYLQNFMAACTGCTLSGPIAYTV
ncbi:hypothetical protein LTR49_028577, partial [Elasticomyces elasticus]